MKRLPLYTELGTDRQPLAELLPLAGPLSVFISTTSACNYSCAWCPVSGPTYQQDYGKGRMSTADFGTILGKLNSSGALKVVRLYDLGEPLMDPTLHEKIQLVVRAGLRSEVTTNGFLLTQRWAERLVASGLQYLRVSLYDRDREQILENVRNLWKIRTMLGAVTPLIHVQTFGEADERFQPFSDSMGTTPLHNWSGLTDASLNALPAKKEVCPSPFYSLTVTWRGDVLPCCVAPAGFTMGNLLTDSLDDVWNGERFERLRLAHLARQRTGACASCNYDQLMPDNLDSYQPAMVGTT